MEQLSKSMKVLHKYIMAWIFQTDSLIFQAETFQLSMEKKN